MDPSPLDLAMSQALSRPYTRRERILHRIADWANDRADAISEREFRRLRQDPIREVTDRLTGPVGTTRR